MNKVKDLLLNLDEQGIRLYLADGKLKSRSLPNAITEEVATLIKENRDRIYDYLSYAKDLDQEKITRCQDTKNSSIPSSFAQKRLWFIDAIQGGTPEYNMQIVQRISGQMDLSVLDRIFSTIISRHEVLRTVYVEEDGEILQEILENYESRFKFNKHVIVNCDEGSRQNALKRIIKDDLTRPFDLSDDLMIRATLIEESSSSFVLIINIHHIASDGWSLALLTNEFFTLYEAFSSGLENPLPELEIQYSDYAHWQRKELNAVNLAKKLSYWQNNLSGVPVTHNIPLDFERPAIKEHRGGMVWGHMPESIARRLLGFAKMHQLSPFMLMHAVLALVLSRNSNSTDIVVGTPLANRLKQELSPIIGLFVNTVVLRLDTNHNTLGDFIDHVKTVHAGAQANQDVPFDKLVENLSLPRSLKYSPLFQILLTTDTDYGIEESNLSEHKSLPSLEISEIEPDYLQIMFDLEVKLSVSEKEVRVNWLYDVSLFEEARIKKLNDQFCRLLKEIVELPLHRDMSLSAVPIFSHEEIQGLLYDYNKTKVDHCLNFCLHELFDIRARQNPDALALIFEGEKVTYGELNAMANQLAHYLHQEHNMKADTIVAVCIERSIEMVVAILGIMKAGGAYLPLDPAHPIDRLMGILQDSRVGLVLSKGTESKCLGEFHGAIVLLDQLIKEDHDSEFLSGRPRHSIRAAPNVKLSDLAYVIYTSGSTGEPKGVMVEHGALLNRIVWMNNQYGLCAEDRVLQKTPYSFDVSVWEFFWTLSFGATLVIAKPEGHKEPGYLCDLIQKEKVTILHFVPSMLDVMLHTERFSDCFSIKKIFCSGEELLKNYVFKCKQMLPNTELHNLYGPTEAAIDVSFWDCNGDIGKNIPIGLPIDNLQLLVLDSKLQLLPEGVIGELYIGGTGLARGYLNRENLTKEKFIENPHFDRLNPNTSQRLYRTGDLVRRLPDGNLEFIGRIDTQVKIRGFRIELGEIEYQLSQHNMVDSCIVVVRKIAGVDQLVSYVKFFNSHDENNNAQMIDCLREKLAETLPSYMIPMIYQVINQWPLTSNGKIDRKSLPEPDLTKGEISFVAVKTHTEKVLAEIWSDLLAVNIEKIGRRSNYFDLGGQSLLSMHLVSQVRKKLDVELSLQKVFDSPVLSDMASVIEVEKRGSDVVGIQRVPRDTHCYISSFSQKLLCHIDSNQGSSEEYNRPHAYRLKGPFDLAIVNRVFSEIVRRHEILRTVYIQDNGEVFQHVKSDIGDCFFVQEYDLISIKGQDKKNEVNNIIDREVKSPIDIKEGLAFRVSYIKLEKDEGILIFNVHQIVWDGWSVEVFTREFLLLYKAFCANISSPLPELDIQFVDFAFWQRSQFSNPDNEKLAYWKNQLKEIAPLHGLTLDKPRPKVKKFVGDIVLDHLCAETSRKLQDLAKHYKLSPFMLLHSAVLMLLSRRCGQKDVVVGTPVANRMQEELEPLIGFISNFLVLRANTDFQTLRELFAHVRKVHFDAQKNQDVPFELLLDELNVDMCKSYTPLFQILLSSKTNFKLSGIEREDYTMDRVEIEKYDLGLARAEYDLQIDLHINKQGVRIKWVYDIAIFERSTIEELNVGLKGILNNFSNMGFAENKLLKEI